MWEFIGIACAIYMVGITHAFAAEIATGWMYEWHHGWQEKFKPVRTAYRAHINRHGENGPYRSEEKDRD